MRTHALYFLNRALIGAALLLATALTVHAHETSVPPASGEANGAQATFSGTVDELIVDDRLAGSVFRYPLLRLADGNALLMRGEAVSSLQTGAMVKLTGQRRGGRIEVAQAQFIGHSGIPSTKVAPGGDLQGRFAIAHFDNFVDGVGGYLYEVHADNGTVTRLAMNFLPPGLQGGSQVIISGRVAADGVRFDPQQITVVGPPPKDATSGKALAKAGNVNKTLVIQVNFAGLTPPANFFTSATAVMTTSTGSVTNYYSEVSYGQQTLSVTLTSDWVTMPGYAEPKDTNNNVVCIDQDLTNFTNAANAASKTLAGLDPATFGYVVYLFPNYGKCGWSGLAYVGWPHQAYINGTGSFVTSVVAHEMGHNFGLWHAGSLRCSGVPIGCKTGDAGASAAEYGDPFSTMGNQHAGHFNSAQKFNLGWFAPTAVITHHPGIATYTLSPIETAGASLYAVTIPSVKLTRTYWVEYRQPVGSFDTFGYTSNGAQIRVESPFDVTSGADDTELIDATPATGTYTDAAFTVGQPFNDPQTGVNVSVQSVTAGANGALTVQVTVPNWLDLDSDGRSDVIWGHTSGVYYAWLMNGSGYNALSLGAPGYVATAAGDVTGEGRSSIIWFNSTTGGVAVWRMNGSGVVGAYGLGPVAPGWTIAGIGDINGDGRADIIWRDATGHTVAWLMNWNGTTITYTAKDLGVVGGTWVLKGVADLDGDGYDDLIWFNTADSSVVAWLMWSSGVKSVASLGKVPGWNIVKIADFDGDGKADILWRSGASNVIWYMNGGAVSAVDALPSVGGTWNIIAAGDYDGDGKSDLLWRDATGAVYQWRMMGRGVMPLVSYVSTIDSTWNVVAQ